MRRFVLQSALLIAVLPGAHARALAQGIGKPAVKDEPKQAFQELLTLKGHTGLVFSVAFSPDGKKIVSGSWDKTVKVWDAATGQELITLKGHTGWVKAVAFSPDGKKVVSGDSFPKAGPPGQNVGAVKVWDATSGKQLLNLITQKQGVTRVAFSPDGLKILAGCSDSTLRLWDAANGREMLTLNAERAEWLGFCSLAFSPDGKKIVNGSSQKDANRMRQGTVRVWDAATGQATLAFTVLDAQSPTSAVMAVAYSPDGKRIVGGGGNAGGTKGSFAWLKVWDAATGKETLSFKVNDPQSLRGGVHGVAFSPDGTKIVSGGKKTVDVWDAENGQKLMTLRGHTGFITSVAFSPDGKKIVSGGDFIPGKSLSIPSIADNLVRVWGVRPPPTAAPR